MILPALQSLEADSPLQAADCFRFTASPNTTALGAARFATAAAFFLDGVTFATWVTRIPVIQEQLHLRNAVLGVALLMISLGAMISMPLAGRFTARFGSRVMSAFTVGLFGAGLLLPGYATSIWSLCVALLVFGTGFGGINVAANAQAVTVERAYGRPIMASFHAIFSLGGIVGAAIGSVAAARHVPPAVHFTIVGVLVVAISTVLWRWLLHDRVAAERVETKRAAIFWPFIGLGTIAFCSAMGEGSMSDWSAVFLRQVSHSNASVAALGFAAFSCCMTAGRLAADRVTLGIGPSAVVRLGGTIAAIGLALAMLLPGPITAIAGFALVGLGLAALIPTTFSAAGRIPGVPASVAIAAVSTMGYFGFLVGPPIIGVASEWVTLRWALALVLLACATAAYLATRGILQRSAPLLAASSN